MTESLWFYIDRDEQTIGPLTFRDMDVLLRTNTIDLSTLAWRDGMENWEHIGQISEFIQSVAENDIEIALHLKSDSVSLPVLTEEQKVKLMQKTQEIKKKKHKKQKQKKQGKWYTPKMNTNLYISGLPKDITPEEVKDFFTKAGVIRIDKFTGLPKIKLYHDDKGKLKGDGLISYVLPESLTIAVTMLNKKEIKPGYSVNIEPAEFNQKGDYIARKKVEVDKLMLIRARTLQDKLMGWNEDTEQKGLRIIIFQNLFEVERFSNEIKQKLVDYVEENIGEVERSRIFQFNPEGVAEIKFKKASDADRCIEEMNGREYNGRIIKCFYWDGKTDFRKVKFR